VKLLGLFTGNPFLIVNLLFLLACTQVEHEPVRLAPWAAGFAGQSVGSIARRQA
jgi:hypothetical protein